MTTKSQSPKETSDRMHDRFDARVRELGGETPTQLDKDNGANGRQADRLAELDGVRFICELTSLGDAQETEAWSRIASRILDHAALVGWSVVVRTPWIGLDDDGPYGAFSLRSNGGRGEFTPNDAVLKGLGDAIAKKLQGRAGSVTLGIGGEPLAGIEPTNDDDRVLETADIVFTFTHASTTGRAPSVTAGALPRTAERLWRTLTDKQAQLRGSLKTYGQDVPTLIVVMAVPGPAYWSDLADACFGGSIGTARFFEVTNAHVSAVAYTTGIEAPHAETTVAHNPHAAVPFPPVVLDRLFNKGDTAGLAPTREMYDESISRGIIPVDMGFDDYRRHATVAPHPTLRQLAIPLPGVEGDDDFEGLLLVTDQNKSDAMPFIRPETWYGSTTELGLEEPEDLPVEQ